MNNILWGLFSLFYFIGVYGIALINSLDNYYVNGIDSIKNLFRYIVWFYLFIQIFITVYILIKKDKLILAFYKKIIQIIIFVNFLVLFLNFMPCLYSSKNMILYEVLKESFLCPKFSNRSYIGIVFNIIFALLSWYLVKKKNRKLKM